VLKLVAVLKLKPTPN